MSKNVYKILWIFYIMDSYSYNSYARYYDRTFPSDFQKRCNESAALKNDYQINFNNIYPIINDIKIINEINIKSEPETNTESNLEIALNPGPKVD